MVLRWLSLIPFRIMLRWHHFFSYKSLAKMVVNSQILLMIDSQAFLDSFEPRLHFFASFKQQLEERMLHFDAEKSWTPAFNLKD